MALILSIGRSNIHNFTPLEKAADFSRRLSSDKADGGLRHQSAQTVRELRSLTGFTVSYSLSKFLCWLCSLIFFPLKVDGKEHIPKIGKAIIASNHVSYLDPPAVGVACPRVVSFMARDTLLKNPLWRWALKGIGVISLRKSRSDVSALKIALKRLSLGQIVVLFPEGTRSPDGEIKSGSEGVGFIARKSKAPVIPVYVKGTDKALPRGAKKMRRHRVHVYFGAPLVIDDFEDLSDREITDRIMQRIVELKNLKNR